ncbi:MAG: hypothetical protein U9N53_00355 [Bacteroidota bacterium]|nr:hypothetical protein [Bacteroidota bacterium]
MNSSLPNKYFDYLFRDRYKKHTIHPENELWENINSRLNQKALIISLRKIQRLRIAVTVLALALVGSLVLIVTDLMMPENPTTDLNKQDQLLPKQPTEAKTAKPLNQVRQVNFSDQEQDIPETNIYLDIPDSLEVLSR